MKDGAQSKKPSFQGRMELLGSLAGFIVDFLATELHYPQIKYWLDHKSELKKKLRDVFSITDEYREIRAEWEKFYKEHLSWTVDFNRVIIPRRPDGNWRLLFISKGMTINRAFNHCKILFKSWCYYSDDLDTAIPTNTRTTSEHYAVWVHDCVEPDVEYLGKSTQEVDPDMKIGMTVLERLILEIKYFLETGNHLDINGVTLCSGSLNSSDLVPRAYWSGNLNNGRFEVYWYTLSGSCDGFGVRSAVSL